MTRRNRKSRNLALIFVLFLFSVSVMGNVDSRLHIGGNYWEDSVYESNYVEEGFEQQGEGTNPYLEEDVDTPENDVVEAAERSRAREVFGVDVEPTAFDIDDQASEPVETEIQERASVDQIEEESAPTASAEDDKAQPTEIVTARPNEEISDSETEAGPVVVEEAAPVDPGETEVHEEPVPEPEPEKRPSIHSHTVRSGETLWDIANAYGISVDTILSANDIANSNRIQVGQELKILTVQGVLHTVASGESLWEISQRYKISMDEIVRANSISNPSRIQPATQIVIPGATQIRPRDVLVVNGQLQRAFDWPTRGRLSSPFGPRWGTMHNGIDLAVPTGTPIRAAADGRVTFSGWNGGYGYLVIIDHGNGVETRYAHHSRNIAQVGQRVERGQIIAYSGNTGNSTGPHLHFEIRYRGTPVDPQKFLR